MVKATFSLPAETLALIRRTAARQGKAQSQVVRDAVADYAERADRLTERERQDLLTVLDGLRTTPRGRSARAVDDEIAAVRAARRHGGRQS